jgi:hypothetical protein
MDRVGRGISGRIIYQYAELLPMSQASYPATAVPSAEPVVSGRVSRRIRIFFSFIVDALHESRRRQAQRVHHQYRHLIARAPEGMVIDPESREARS